MRAPKRKASEKKSAVSVFLSHNRADKGSVRALGNQLRMRGAEVWIDEAEIKAGDSLLEKISDGVTRSDFLIVALSRSSVRSEWVKRELNIALTQEIKGRRVKVIPILLEKCTLPAFLLDKKYVDFSRNEVDAVRQLCKDLGIEEPDRSLRFLRNFVFYDLIKRNEDFDVEVIDHVSRTDFLKALERVAFFGVEVHGVEVFSCAGEFLDVIVAPSRNRASLAWVRRFVRLWERETDVVFSASYTVPDGIAKLFV